MLNVLSNQVSPELPINANFTALLPFEMGARNPATSAGLTWGFWGGTWAGVVVPNGTVTLLSLNNNYIVLDLVTGVVSSSNSTTNWNNGNGYARLYLVVTNAGGVSSITDWRSSPGGIFGKFGGGKLTTPLDFADAPTVASAGNMFLGAVSSNFVVVSGSTTINNLGGATSGAMRILWFTGAPIMTHSAALDIPGAVNRRPYINDLMLVICTGGSNWRVVYHQRSTGDIVHGNPMVVIPSSGAMSALGSGLGSKYRLTMIQNGSLAPFTNPLDGQEFFVRIRQDATGNRVITFDPVYVFPTGMSKVLSTAPNSVDLLSCTYDAELAVFLCRLDKGFA